MKEIKIYKQCPVCGSVSELSEPTCMECGYDYSMSNTETKIISNSSDDGDYIFKGEKINLSISEVWVNRNEHCPSGVIGIDWASDIGRGRFEMIIGEDGKLRTSTECMDKGDDKSFSKAILNKLLDLIVIED